MVPLLSKMEIGGETRGFSLTSRDTSSPWGCNGSLLEERKEKKGREVRGEKRKEKEGRIREGKGKAEGREMGRESGKGREGKGREMK